MAADLDYWARKERWESLGRKLADLQGEAARLGVPLEDVPGARATVAAFRKLSRTLDRSGGAE